MRKRFCPKCGVTIDRGTLCSTCAYEEVVYESPLVQVSEFNRTWHKGSWHHFNNLDDVLVKRVREVIGSDVAVDIEPFEFDPKPKEKIVVQAKAFLDDQVIDIPIKLSYRQCDYGQKEKTGYFEGILQIHHVHDEVVEYIEREMKKVSHKGVFITKTVDTKHGVDLYMTNKTQMRLLGQRLVNKFGGTLDLNPQLFSHNHETSKDIYRLNILVKLAPFKTGEVISFDRFSSRGKLLRHEYLRVSRLGRLIQGIDLATGKSDAFELRYAKDISILPQHKTTIASVSPSLGIIHPSSFQEVLPLNEDLVLTDYAVGDEVMVVVDGKKLFLVN